VPVLETDFPDPFVLVADGIFYGYATNPARGTVNVQLASSRDLIDWALMQDTSGHPKDAMPKLPPWAKRGWTWAPEVLRTGTDYLLYFTAKEKKSGLQCVGVAPSADPQGPFTSEAAKPLVCQRDLGGTIDASPFRDSDGQLYLYFKNDGNAVRKPTALYVQALSADGLSLAGQPVELLRSKPLGKSWEQDVIEAPSMVRMGDTYVLFFSGGYFGWPRESRLSPYAIGYAICISATGPCTERPEPILFSRSGAAGCISGPGHQAVFQVRTRWFLAYHGWSVTPSCRPLDPIRWLYISPMAWRDGKPVIGPTVRLNPPPSSRP
jgi:beta-xylosidase